MPQHKILAFFPSDPAHVNEISRKLGISNVLAQVLVNRGMRTSEEARRFLDSSLSDLHDPLAFNQMQRAVEIVRDVSRKGGQVMVFGDYDVDGITALTLIKNTLLGQGINSLHYIPHRVREGYGLNREIVAIAKEKGVSLLITADCGTSSQDIIEELRRNHTEVVVTDHHEPAGESPTAASAIINPKLKDSGYAFRELAGVGVAYKFCQALSGELLVQDLDLVSLGTIADAVPLAGENRIIAKEGLKMLSVTKRAGLRALIESAGIAHRKFDTTAVTFMLGPRLNASGRMDTAEVALNLLLSTRQEEADMLARTVETYNRQRQKVENRIFEEAQALIDKEINFKEHKVIVIAKEDWHQGVLGIVASKLADKFYRPTILISKTEALCKGSGRSIRNFHLFQALVECGDFLEAFGGHSHAAGIVIANENIEEFRKKINRLARERLRFEDLVPTLEVDMELRLSDLDLEVAGELEGLEPFGVGNPEPLFYTRGLTLKGEPRTLSRYTLKFWVSDGTATYQAIAFGMSSMKESLVQARSFELVYSPRIDTWGGEGKLILEVRDIFVR